MTVHPDPAGFAFDPKRVAKALGGYESRSKSERGTIFCKTPVRLESIRVVIGSPNGGFPNDFVVLEALGTLPLTVDERKEAVAFVLGKLMDAGLVIRGDGTPFPASAKTVRATPADVEEWWDDEKIAPRQWVYGHHLIRGFVSGTAAPGGAGKSSLLIADMLAMATGRNLLGDEPAGPLRVWYINGEDPLDEIRRRVRAAGKHYGITAEELRGRLFLDSGRDTEIVVAHQTPNGVVVAEDAVKQLIKTIREDQIDIVIVDPFVSCHRVNENDNMSINVVMEVWRRIAEETDTAVTLIPHTRKGNGGEMTVDDNRGASAFAAAVRSFRILNTMTDAEAESAGVEPSQRKFHFRVDDGKANMAPPAEATVWRKLVSMTLMNGPGGGEGDRVGVVTEWQWPSPFEDLSPRDLEEVQRAISQCEWREDCQATAWVGKAVAEVLGLNIEDKAVKKRVKGLLTTWIKNGALVVVKRWDPKRGRDHRFVEVGRWPSE